MRNFFLLTISLAICGIIFIPQTISAQYNESKVDFVRKSNNIDSLIEKAGKDKEIMVIVGLNLDTTPEGYLSFDQKTEQINSIRNVQNNLTFQLLQFDAKILARYKHIPYIAVSADKNTLEFMRTSQLVANVKESQSYEPLLAQSRQIVETHLAEAQGYTGDGQVVAILDSGVDKNHPFLVGRVISEACYSRPSFIDEFDDGENTITYETINQCGGQTATTGPNTGFPCTGSGACDHGTHVAGIAAGNGITIGKASGIAKDAEIIAIQVFTRHTIRFNGNLTSNSIIASEIDILAALDRIIELRQTTNYNIAAVNISIGNNPQSSECSATYTDYKDAMEALKSYSIATILASGNDNATNGISDPACVDPGVSVGATNDGSSFGGYSATPLDGIWVCPAGSGCVGNGTNSASFLDLLAPGALIESSVPGGGFEHKVGTSMAAPHVTGAWAVIKERFPGATVDQILNALKVTGTPITDNRSGAGGRIKPRINIAQAITYLEQTLSSTRFDFDGDGKAEASVFRPNDGDWYVRTDTGGYNVYDLGVATDTLTPADFDGDGTADIAVWRESTGEWFYIESSTSSIVSFTFGLSGDIPAPGDFDGDGDDEATVYRPSEGKWYVRNPDGSATVTQFGIAEDKPVVEDYDGDGTDDIAVYRPSLFQWHLNRSTDGYAVYQFGAANDQTVQGDYTGDGKADVAIFRPGTNEWFILRSEDLSFYSLPYGASGDIPTPGDYDGDGKHDQSVYRPGTNTWYINGSTSGSQQFLFGTAGDIPVPNAYVFE